MGRRNMDAQSSTTPQPTYLPPRDAQRVNPSRGFKGNPSQSHHTYAALRAMIELDSEAFDVKLRASRQKSLIGERNLKTSPNKGRLIRVIQSGKVASSEMRATLLGRDVVSLRWKTRRCCTGRRNRLESLCPAEKASMRRHSRCVYNMSVQGGLNQASFRPRYRSRRECYCDATCTTYISNTVRSSNLATVHGHDTKGLCRTIIRAVGTRTELRWMPFFNC